MSFSEYDFYNRLLLGSFVHNFYTGYPDPRFVRYKIVEYKGKRRLQAVALIGKWQEKDYCTRYQDGSIHWISPVREIRKEVLHPYGINPIGLYEYEMTGVDPRDMPETPLVVTPLTDEQKKQARLWRKINKIRSILPSIEKCDINNIEEMDDPDTIIRRILETLQ